MRAKVRGLSKGLVDYWIERSDASDEVAPDRPNFRLLRSVEQECADKSPGDFGRYRRELNGQSVPRATKIGSCMYNARADNTDADFACSGDGEHKDIGISASDRTQLIARDDRRRDTG